MMAPAPGLFSMTTGWPSRLLTASAAARAMRSLAPPGPNGTTQRIGWSGQSARTAPALQRAIAIMAGATSVARKRRIFMQVLLDRCAAPVLMRAGLHVVVAP